MMFFPHNFQISQLFDYPGMVTTIPKNSRLGGALFDDQVGGNRHNWEAPIKC